MNIVVCSIDGCDRPVKNKMRGLCNMHYKRHLYGPAMDAPISKPRGAPAPMCVIEGCTYPGVSRGWCQAHYKRWRKYGDPTHGGRDINRRRPAGIDPVDWFWQGFTRSENGCLEWHRGTIGDYGDASGVVDGERLCHRIAWILTHGPIPDGLWVLHHCDNPPCGDALGGHLFLGDVVDNNRDMFAKGRNSTTHQAKGSAHRVSKLTEADVSEIRRRAATGEAQRHLADEFGVSESLISQVVLRHIWRHLD
jgi:hypothetical protein